MPGSANASTAFSPNFATVATFEEAAPRYDSSGAQLAGPIADRLVSLAGLRPGDQVLDAGCGAGAVTIRSAHAVSPGGQVIGVDLADGMLRRTAAEAAGRGLANVTVRRGHTSRPPFAPGSFDAVLASLVLYLLPDPGDTLRRWREILRPGGTVAFSWGIRPDPRWSPVFGAVDAYAKGADGFEAYAGRAGIPRRDDRHAARARVYRHPDVYAHHAGAVYRATAVVAGLVGGGPGTGLAAHPGRRPGRRLPRGLRPAGTDVRTRRQPGPPGRDGVRGRAPAARGLHRGRPPWRAPPRQFPARTRRRAGEARQRAARPPPPGRAAGFTAPPAQAARVPRPRAGGRRY